MRNEMFYALVDWGTSSFRLWLVNQDGAVLGESKSDEGMMKAVETGFAAVLERHLHQLGAPADLPVLISGMAGARQGWVEAPYLPVPARLDRLAEEAVHVPKAGRDIRIIPGVAQIRSDAANVMRGEETQLAGVVETLPDGLVCMPGTHCKWVSIADRQVTGFTSFMTGELFAVLSQHSILKHAVDPANNFDAQTPAFARAAEHSLKAPEQALAMLFQIRASQLLNFEQHADGAAHLSGVLIGAEVGTALRNYGGGKAGLVASERLNRLYRPVMEQAGFSVQLFDGEKVVRAGLLAAARLIHSQSGV
ncbi:MULTISPECIES: 2-dehydro-3-deoxygalactonokinase [Brucella/Ochrobactrum group]|uniref:2-dehydro-3-deoxygalactonokinase n=2 Tax=Brucellaceae TaxID=118882 RepID=UPI000D708CC3|nr:2-dehydro-3-deoxygalactonokinase [Ochrobactrum sp. POC9]